MAVLRRPAEGLRLEPIGGGFAFPTSFAFGPAGTVYVAESGLGFGGAQRGGRVWRLKLDGSRELVLEGLRAPVNGLAFAAGDLYISEGGNPGRISCLEAGGGHRTVLDDLPGGGNYQTNMAVIGADGWLYFSQGAMTNLGVVGLDAYQIGWLGRLPHGHDLPGLDVELVGINFETANPLDPQGGTARTGAFAEFGVAGKPGERLRAALPCTASVMRCRLDGSGLELVAWGLRNAYGLGFLADGRLLATDQGADDRGSRPIGDAPDLLYDVRVGCWYGWPDYIGGEPVTAARFRPSRGSAPSFVLANHNRLPPPQRPLYSFEPHSGALKFAASPEGWLAVALFGDERPMTAPAGPRAGRCVIALDLDTGRSEAIVREPLERPIDVAFDESGRLWVLDFGRFEMTERGPEADPGSGRLYRALPPT